MEKLVESAQEENKALEERLARANAELQSERQRGAEASERISKLDIEGSKVREWLGGAPPLVG